MQLALALLGISYAFELLLFLSFTFKIRKLISPLVLISAAYATFFVIQFLSLPAAIAFAFISAYRLFNIYRLGFGLSHKKRLLKGGFKTSWHLAFIAGVLLASALMVRPRFGLDYLLPAVSALVLVLACMALLALRLSLKRMVMPALKEHHALKDLPTLTVAIPARNETQDLTECLSTLIKTTYPKLEILTLDDCSQEKRTPEIIRDFAHDGVRFLKGELPPEPWLAKNYAYKQLLDQANGEYVLFCGVDARFEPHTVTRLIECIVQSKKNMISLVPINQVSRGHILPYLLQPIRYAWEIALPRRWNKRPPVLSTCWIGKRDFLLSNGGFESLKQSIQPERHLARKALDINTYGFYRTDPELALTSVKSGSEQLETALRMRYPTLKKAPENVMFVGLGGIIIAAWPAIMAFYAAVNSNPLLLSLNLLTIVVLSILYAVVDKTTYNKFKLVSFICMPFALVFDAVVLNVSMFRYEFSQVLWKGRNICLPLLQTIPQLPKLSDRW